MDELKQLEKIQELERQIAGLPIGYISKKTINGKVRYYHQWTENRKKHSQYLRDGEMEVLQEQIDRRKSLQAQLKELQSGMPKARQPKLDFETSVIAGRGLEAMSQGVKDWGLRDCFEQLEEYLYSKESDRVCLIFGLRRTGKTTMLRIIGGFLTPTSGDVLFNGKRINDLPAYQRKINTVFQRYALFPHLDVYDNIAFGLRIAKVKEDEIDERVTEMLEIVSLKGFENRKVTSLSGGQQQRVAIARALVNRPQVLLLDEPLGALDLRLRKDMQNELKNIQQRMGITFIYVTHDQEEALTMSDTIVVMNKGKIQQIGRPEDIYNEPKNAFVADFIGESNILDGVMLEDYVVKFFGRKFQCVDKGFAPNEPVDVVIRPEDVDIVPPEQGHLCGTVTSVTFKGVHYDTIVDFKGFKWLIQTTDYCPVDAYIGIRLNPEDIHIMHKSEYSGLYGDYSSYSAEYDEIADASEEEADEE